MENLSELELEELAGPASYALPDAESIPEEIVDRAKKLAPTRAQVERVLDIPEDRKLGLLAHVLEGVEFQRRFVVFGDIDLTFMTLTASQYQLLERLSKWKTRDQAERADYFDDLAMATSLGSWLPEEHRSHRDNDMGYQHWLQSQSEVAYLAAKRCYREFRDELEYMISQADSRNFWPTPY